MRTGGPGTRLCFCLLGSGLAWLAGLFPPPAAGAEGDTPAATAPAAATPDAAVESPPSPLSPEQALASFQLEPGIRVELVAAKPTIDSPVAVAFDSRGRMLVAEDRGYPTGPAAGADRAVGRYRRRRKFRPPQRVCRGTLLSQRVDGLAPECWSPVLPT